MAFFRDVSVPAVVAGFVTVLVGDTSSAVIVFQAARAVGADEAGIASWLWALGLGMGLTSIVLSLRWRVPVVTAWSTPGAAMLITGATGVSLAEASGAFIVCSLLIALAGFSGAFERVMNRIPAALGAGMLAGVLLRFGLDVFVAMKTAFTLALTMFAVYLLGRRLAPRYAVVATLVVGVTIAAAEGRLHVEALRFAWTMPVAVLPAWSPAALVGVALPLFIVTMASQNVPGVAVLRAAGYTQTPVSPLIGWTGVAGLLLAPFGAYALNLAAITAAICMGRDVHPDPARRYPAAVVAGVGYLFVGLCGSAVVSLFTALPRELVMAIAGLALLGTIGNGLALALGDERQREPALVTFLVTASGISFGGIGSAFWGACAGLLALAVARLRRRA